MYMKITKSKTVNEFEEEDEVNYREQPSGPVYSHNPYHSTKFPLLVLDVRREHCEPYNEGFRVLHWHDEVQFVYIKKGAVHFKIWEEECDLSAGSCMFLNSGVLHRITEKEDCHYHSFLIPPKMLGFFSGSAMEEKQVERIIKNPAVMYLALSPGNNGAEKALKKLRELDVLYFEKKEDDFREYELSLSIAALWLETVHILMEKDHLPHIRKKDHDRICALLAFVHENYQNPLSLEDIAAAGNVSKTECLRCFRKYTGYSPYQYLLRYRLQAGEALLKSSDKTVTDIACQLQFPSPSAFIASFRRFYGMTPAAYRKRQVSEKL